MPRKRKTIVVWFRQDLRLSDNPALCAASKEGQVLPVYIWSPDEESRWSPGSAGQWWINRSVGSLRDRISRKGGKLVIRSGSSSSQLSDLSARVGANAVYWNRRYEPAVSKRDDKIERLLREGGIGVRRFNGSLLFEPWDLATQQGGPYKVFTPYWRAIQQLPVPSEAVGEPEISWLKRVPGSEVWEDLGLVSADDRTMGFGVRWQPGEVGGREMLDAFINEGLGRYDSDRDRPDVIGTSRLSPYLHHGELSPRQVWHAVREAKVGARSGVLRQHIVCYQRQLVWREFAYHLLHHYPKTPVSPLYEKYKSFPWRKDRKGLKLWQRGETGYPIVDAGMRELCETGWMHNRVRMIVGSFLVKDLLLSWTEGSKWFWDRLVDADLANNTLGWQWVAGCGADASPYFRVFNPVLQGKKFDPDGDYVRRYVPELKDVPSRYIHEPWKWSGIGSCDYASPMVDHGEARDRALGAFGEV